jgi:hypothetical protein
MMENFSDILQHLSIKIGMSSSRSHFGGTSPFKVHVIFYILVFEGHIDANALDKWLNLLEGYLFVHHFFDKENSPPCQTLVGNLLGEKFQRGVWNIWG